MANEPDDNDAMPDVSDVQTESVDSSDKEEEEEDNIEHEDYSRFGRKRRKPIWLQDFVSSIFSKTGPNLKITPRKREICPICKLIIEGETFGDHVDRCVKNRHQCGICGILCAKPQALKQHIRRKHSGSADREYKLKSYSKNLKRSFPKIALKTSSGDKKEESVQEIRQPPKEEHSGEPAIHKRSWALSDDLRVSSSEESDWNDDPKIELNEDPAKEDSDSEEEDRRKVQELKVGRVFRKPFEPTPVMAPIKRRKPEETVTSVMLKTELEGGSIVKKDDNHPEVATGSKSKTDAVIPEADGIMGDIVNQDGNSGNLKLKFGVTGKAGDKVTQSFMLHQNGELLMDSKVLRAAGSGMGDTEVNMGDFTRSSIKPENI